MFARSWGGSRPGSGRPPRLDEHIRLGVALEVCEAMARLQEAERFRKYEEEHGPYVQAARRRIDQIASRFHSRTDALRQIMRGASQRLDKIGRLWGCAVQSWRAEAIREVAERHNLPPRAVRDCYREFRKRVPEPEPMFTVFDTFERPTFKRRRVLQAFGIYKGLPPEAPESEIDFAKAMTTDELRHKRNKLPPR